MIISYCYYNLKIVWLILVIITAVVLPPISNTRKFSLLDLISLGLVFFSLMTPKSNFDELLTFVLIDVETNNQYTITTTVLLVIITICPSNSVFFVACFVDFRWFRLKYAGMSYC